MKKGRHHEHLEQRWQQRERRVLKTRSWELEQRVKELLALNSTHEEPVPGLDSLVVLEKKFKAALNAAPDTSEPGNTRFIQSARTDAKYRRVLVKRAKDVEERHQRRFVTLFEED